MNYPVPRQTTEWYVLEKHPMFLRWKGGCSPQARNSARFAGTAVQNRSHDKFRKFLRKMRSMRLPEKLQQLLSKKQWIARPSMVSFLLLFVLSCDVELDELEDDLDELVLEQYRKKRIEEMMAKAKTEKVEIALEFVLICCSLAKLLKSASPIL